MEEQTSKEHVSKLLKHSGLGIFSCVLAGLVLIVYLSTYVYVLTQGRYISPVMKDVVGVVFILCLLVNVLAVFMAIMGFMQKDRSKLYDVLGLILSLTFWGLK